jgi:hypothetical protein
VDRRRLVHPCTRRPCMPNPSKGDSYIGDDYDQDRHIQTGWFSGVETMPDQQELVWHRLSLGSSSVGASCIVPWFVLSIKSDKERTGIMLYVLHSRCGFDFGPLRALGWPARYGGIRPRIRHGDDKLRGNHGKDSRSYGASTDRSP